MNYMIKIVFNRKKCIGCGYCEDLSPNNWEMDLSDGKSNLLNSVNHKEVYIAYVDYEELDANINAAKSCPVNVISVEY